MGFVSGSMSIPKSISRLSEIPVEIHSLQGLTK